MISANVSNDFISRTIDITSYQSGLDLTDSLFKRYIMENSVPYVKSDSWTCVEHNLDKIFLHPIHYYKSTNHEAVVAHVADSMVYLYVNDGRLSLFAGASTLEKIEHSINLVRTLLPVADINEGDRRIPMYLWVMVPGQGPRKIRRVIDTPSWSDIRENYTSSIQTEMDKLVLDRPESGKIILWSGEPGTGKSFALRSLGWGWRKLLDIHYIVDPETMFGTDASYLVNLLFDEDDKEDDGDERWRLIVLEDTGEMLTKDAKQHVGQALSRLLNVTDGLLGQGLRLLTLVTTNEELGALHPAVTRPGRCAAEMNFTSLTSRESAEWMINHNVEGPTRERTIAELYALAENRLVASKQSTGFRLSAD